MIKFLVKIFPFVALGTFIIGIIIGVPRLIKISEVTCESQFGPCDESTLAEIKAFESLSFNSAKRGLNDYLESLSYIDKFAVRFLLPSKLKVVLVQKKPIFGLSRNGAQSVALVDREGQVLSYEAATLLPLLNISGSAPPVGENVDAETAASLKILAYMNSLFGIKEGGRDADSLIFNLNSGQTMIFPLNGDVEVLVGRAILINSRLNKALVDSKMEDEKGLESCRRGCIIDLRYKNPVVRI